MYAANRGPAHVPWTPNTEEDKQLEQFRAKQAQVQEELAAKKGTEKVDEDSDGDFGLLDDMFGGDPVADNGESFKVVDFKDWLKEQNPDGK